MIIRKDGTLTEEGEKFLFNAFSFSREKKEEFVQSLVQENIPLNEKSFQKIILTPEFYDYTQLPERVKTLQKSLEKLNSLTNLEQSQLQCEISTLKKIRSQVKEDGAHLFSLLTGIGEWPNKVVFQENTPILLLPSQTVSRIFLETINPLRKLTVKRCLGVISAKKLEDYFDRNIRLTNLFAPGVSAPHIVHNYVSCPAFIHMHDQYHWYLVGSVSQETYEQLFRLKSILRSILHNKKIFTTEIFLCIDCEISTKILSPQIGLKNFLHKIFNQSPINIVIAIMDMILYPECWPHSPEILDEIISFLPLERSLPSVGELSDAIRCYYEIAKKDYAITVILILCHFYLNDASFSQALKNNIELGSIDVQMIWRKHEDKHLCPVLVINKISYDLDNLKKLSPEDRIKLLTKSMYFISPSCSLSTRDIFIHINSGSGKVIIDNETRKVTGFYMPRDNLTEDICKLFGLDRECAMSLTKEQVAYLKRYISTITIEFNSSGLFLLTFPLTKKSLVENVLLHWVDLQKTEVQAVNKIQALSRGHLVRVGLFRHRNDSVNILPSFEASLVSHGNLVA